MRFPQLFLGGTSACACNVYQALSPPLPKSLGMRLVTEMHDNQLALRANLVDGSIYFIHKNSQGIPSFGCGYFHGVAATAVDLLSIVTDR